MKSVGSMLCQASIAPDFGARHALRADSKEMMPGLDCGKMLGRNVIPRLALARPCLGQTWESACPRSFPAS